MRILSPSIRRGGLCFAGALLAAPPAGAAQEQGEEMLTDSALVELARTKQREFEEFRESRIPVERERTDATCDERIGRICIWFGGEDEIRFPRELSEVGEARTELIDFLTDANERLADPWVLGQLVHYLVERESLVQAEQVASACGIEERWWCLALTGYALHVQLRYVESEDVFREALATMPEEELAWWIALRYVMTPDAEAAFQQADPDEQLRQWELFWRLSDPLFLFLGNDRLTDHLARLVEAKNFRDAVHPQGLSYADHEADDERDGLSFRNDMEATLIRYGRIIGYSRTHDPSQLARGRLVDTRRVVGHHHPKSRGYLFPERFLESPSEVPPESWITAPREARTWYAPPYAPEIRGLDTQIARFRRDGEMLVVGAYKPTPPPPDPLDPGAAPEPVEIDGPVHSALFLVPEDGSEPISVRGTDSEGVLTMYSWPGRYVSGIEVVDQEGRRAWRARQGVQLLPLAFGVVDASDLMILKEDAPLPETLDEAIPHARPGIRVRQGERFPVVWEVYGLRVEEPIRVTLGFTQGHPGFLARVGEFLGILEPDEPVEVTFEDAGVDLVQHAFRSIELELPDLEPGEYTLHLRLDIAGREPVTKSRPITVVARGAS